MIQIEPAGNVSAEHPPPHLPPRLLPGHAFIATGGLSLSDAAEALGLSRRQVAYYASGAHKVPRTVLLAGKGWEREQTAVS